MEEEHIVYIVQGAEWGNQGTFGVFSSEAKAEQYLAGLDSLIVGHAEVLRCVVDAGLQGSAK